MKLRNRALFIVLFVWILIAQPIMSQQVERPLWVQMEQGIARYDEGRLGDALKTFRLVVERDSSYANAHMWIGHVLAAEGEFEAARRKYEDAIAEGRNFFPRSERIEAYYSLAEVSMSLGDHESTRTYLERVFNEGREEEFPPSRRQAIVNKFIAEGPDKTLELYRLNDKAVRRAYQLYGELELREGKYAGALEHLLFSTMTSLSLAIESRMSDDPEYLFIQTEMNPAYRNEERFYTANTARLLIEAMNNRRLRTYFESIGLYRQLFLLGAAMLGIDEPEKAEKIWLLVTDNRSAGIWFEFAQRQIGNPDLEILPAALQYR